MGYVDAVKSGFRQYATFTGRAARSEFWYWTLFCFIFEIITSFLDKLIFNVPSDGFHPLYTIFILIILIPSIAVTARRLHDVNRSGWWMLIALTVIGIIFPLFYWYVIKGTVGNNDFGADPLVVSP
jgi:uncharacterized membrane protein YhaH (DUF805 family)